MSPVSLTRRACTAAFALLLGMTVFGQADPVRLKPDPTTSAATGAEPAGFARVGELIEEAIAQRQLPGAVVLIGRGDTVLYTHAFGRRALLPAPEPMTEDTMFDLASLTKVVATTTSVMKLVEEGRIRLSDPVARFIPEFARYGKAQITIRHLLTHVSGL